MMGRESSDGNTPEGNLPHEDGRTAPTFYVPRLKLEERLKGLLASRRNVAIYGPARQGKTLLVSKCLPPQNNLYIECRRGFKRSHIYRLILSHLGYSIDVSQKKKKSASYKIAFGLFGSKIGADASGDVEGTLQQINVDMRNPSEVAHLISRIRDVPYVVLNGFERLNRRTRENILLDISFFSEVSKIRFALIGDWLGEDHLETMEPAISGKIDYVHVPYWSDAELRQAHSVWREHKIVPEVGEDTLNEMIDLSVGDIALFATLHTISVERKMGAPFRARAETIIVTRSKKWIGERIGELLISGDFSVSFSIVVVSWALRANPKFVAVSGGRYKRTKINSLTGHAYRNVSSMQVDARGNPRQIEYPTARLENGGPASVIPSLLRMIHRAAKAGKTDVGLDQVISNFTRARLSAAVAVSPDVLVEVYQRMNKFQRRAHIEPPLLVVTGDEPCSVRVGDRRLFLVLRSLDEEEFDEWLSELSPQRVPTPRAKNRLSMELSDAEQQALYAKAKDIATSTNLAGGSAVHWIEREQSRDDEGSDDDA